MSQVLPISLQSLQNDSAALDRIGTNIANITTPGYRREMQLQAPLLAVDGLPGASSVFAAQVAAQARHAQAQLAATGDATPASASAIALRFDPSHGTIKTTDAPLDVALLGGGFFEVETDAGPAYTRDGQFRVDARGTLVTAQGHAVAGRGGQITLTTSPVTIDRLGQVTQDGRNVGQLKVMDLDTAGAIQHPQGGLYTSTTPPQALPDAAIQVRQGALENSNVDHMAEMVQLVQVMRHFETMTRVVQGYDDMMGTAISKLGSF